MNDRSLREHVVNLLEGRGAHVDLETALRGFPAGRAGDTVPGIVHTAWRLLEHIRIAQWDILEFTRNPGHVSPEFPDGYWPRQSAPPTAGAWNHSVKALLEDLRAMQDLVRDPATDLFTPLSHGEGQTVLREALLVADHNTYHLGQLMMLQKALG